MSSLYRCGCTCWLKPAGWKFAIRFEETEVQDASVSIKVPSPGQASNYKTGYALYENSSSGSFSVADKYLLKAGWVGIESAQRLQSVPEISVPEEYKTSIEELTKGIDNPPLVEHLTNAVFATIIIEFSYGYANIKKFLTQKYFFKLKSATASFDTSSYSSVKFSGEGLFRSLLSQTRENQVIKSGTPVQEVVREGVNLALNQSTGYRPKNVEPQIYLDQSVSNRTITTDLRTSGGVPAKSLDSLSVSNELLIVENPTEPFKINIITDTPSTRTAFFLGIGLFEGLETESDNDLQGANVFRNNADRYSTSTGGNSSTYKAEENKQGTLSLPANTPKPFLSILSGDGDKSKEIKLSIPIRDSDNTSGDLTTIATVNPAIKTVKSAATVVDLKVERWLEPVAGNPDIRVLSSDGSIETVKGVHAGFDSPPITDLSVHTLYGGKVFSREENSVKGNGTIVIESDGYITYNKKEYRIYEEYSHCIDHAGLNERVNPGEVIATISDKSTVNSSASKHLHAVYYATIDSSRVYMHPYTVAKFGYIRTDKLEKKTVVEDNIDRAVGNDGGLYPDNEALLRIVLAEARSTGLLGMALVARVIFNRACAKKAGLGGYNTLNNGDSISAVIEGKNQFEPTRSKDNNWKDVMKESRSTGTQKTIAKEAIALAQDPQRLKKKLVSNGVSESVAQELVLSGFFAADGSQNDIKPYVKRIIRFKQSGGSYLAHNFGVGKQGDDKESVLFCGKDKISTSGISNSGSDPSGETDTTSSGNNSSGSSGTSNTLSVAVGGQGFVGIPKLSTSFIGVPRALYIQPGFTYLVFDTRGFIEWAKSGASINRDYKVPIPEEYKDWSIIGMELEWKGDLRVSLDAIRPLFGQNPAFTYKGEPFSEINQWGGNYYKYIRSFTDLCYKIKVGEHAGKNSCDVQTNLNNEFVPKPKPVSINGSSGTDDNPGGTTGDGINGCWYVPCSGKITGIHGEQRATHTHKGVDIAAPIGTPIYATGSGVVIDIQETGSSGYGLAIFIKHNNSFYSEYGHLSKIEDGITKGTKVSGGQKIAEVGNAGASRGAHLHFTVRTAENGADFDPADLLTDDLKEKGKNVEAKKKYCKNNGNGSGGADTVSDESDINQNFTFGKFIPAASTNFEPRKEKIKYIVLHNTVNDFNSSIAEFKREGSEKAAHFIISRKGEVVQMVNTKDTAHHAKTQNGKRAGFYNCQSIGIEHEATEFAKGFTPAMEKASIKLIKALLKKYKLDKSAILPHRKDWGGASSTSCPNLVWYTESLFESWVQKNF